MGLVMNKDERNSDSNVGELPLPRIAIVSMILRISLAESMLASDFLLWAFMSPSATMEMTTDP